MHIAAATEDPFIKEHIGGGSAIGLPHPHPIVRGQVSKEANGGYFTFCVFDQLHSIRLKGVSETRMKAFVGIDIMHGYLPLRAVLVLRYARLKCSCVHGKALERVIEDHFGIGRDPILVDSVYQEELPSSSPPLFKRSPIDLK